MSIKDIYFSYHDRITDKRFNSPHILRRYVHRFNYYALVQHAKDLAPEGGKILDAGCGDGVLTILLEDALKDREVDIFGADISYKNIKYALKRQKESSGRRPVHYHVADAESFPYPDGTFDLVISSHVLEHLPSFEKGLYEIRRLTKRFAVIALPTCLNLCAAALLGGRDYWSCGIENLKALVSGTFKIIRHYREDGVNEWYEGNVSLPHLWRYPWVMKRELKEAGFRILRFEGASLAVPFVATIFPRAIHIQRWIDRLRGAPFFRDLGYGSIAVVEKE